MAPAVLIMKLNSVSWNLLSPSYDNPDHMTGGIFSELTNSRARQDIRKQAEKSSELDV